MSELITRLPHPPELLTHANAAAPAASCACCVSRDTDPARSRLIREHIEGTEHILGGPAPIVGP